VIVVGEYATAFIGGVIAVGIAFAHLGLVTQGAGHGTTIRTAPGTTVRTAVDGAALLTEIFKGVSRLT
jgi:hypothetical protein